MDDLEAMRVVHLVQAAAAPGADPSLAKQARAQVEGLFAAHHPRVVRVCRRFLGDDERSREVAQDVFETAWRRLGEWRQEGSFFSWLYGIARFKCMNALRRTADVLTEDGLLEGVDGGAGPVTALRRHERLALLREAAEAVLDELERDVLRLRYEEGIGQDDITRLLGLPGRSGARGVLVRCRRKLQREIERRSEKMNLGSSYFEVTR